jgi:uncharacterized membrane protein YbhN (UPF0104 family)
VDPLVRKRLGTAIRLLFGLVGLAFLAIAFRSNWDRSRQQILPSAWSFGGASALALGGLSFGARGWVSLLSGEASDSALARGFYTSQLGKYVPGALWQAAGQIGMAARAGVTTSRAVTAFPIHAIAQAAAGGTVGAGLLLVGWKTALAIRFASLSGLLLLPLLRRRWMVKALDVLSSLVNRDWPESYVPSQARILRSYGLAVIWVSASGAGFMLLASSVHATPSMAPAVPAFALAWTAGFLALPFPSGIGVREVVLIAVLGGSGSAAPLVGASVAHRLVTMAAEVVMIAWAAVRRSATLSSGRSPPGAGPI